MRGISMRSLGALVAVVILSGAMPSARLWLGGPLPAFDYEPLGAGGGVAPAVGGSRDERLQRLSLSPLAFEENRGQHEAGIDAVATGSGFAMAIGAGRAAIDLSTIVGGQPRAARLDLILEGARTDAVAEPLRQLPAVTDYCVGPRSDWITGVRNFERLRYRNIYRGVDLLYYGNQERLQYDFAVLPGADPQVIRWRLDGADKLSLDEAGRLLVTLPHGVVKMDAPYTYQLVDGRRREVVSSFRLLGQNRVGFRIGRYDRRLPLIIDPVVTYSTYIRGNFTERTGRVAVGLNDTLIIAGQTNSPSFAYNANARSSQDGFLRMYDEEGVLLQNTYFGGNNGTETVYGIAVDTTNGYLYIVGQTTSTQNWTTGATVHQNARQGGSDGFFTRWIHTAATNTLDTATFIGGDGEDTVYGVAFTGTQPVLVGQSSSNMDMPANLPTPASTHNMQTSAQGGQEGWIFKFATDLSNNYNNGCRATYLSGSGNDGMRAVQVASNGDIVVAGWTESTNFPTRPTNPFQSENNGSRDVTVTRIDTNLRVLDSNWGGNEFSTYLGGSGSEEPWDMVLDTSDRPYIVGWTASTNFDVSAGAFLTNSGGASDAFLTCFNAPGTTLRYSGYLGGTGADVAYGVVLENRGGIFKPYVVGVTDSGSSFPLSRAVDNLSSGTEGFVTKFNSTGGGILTSTFIGGGNDDSLQGVAIDSKFQIWVCGNTSSKTEVPVGSLLNGTAIDALTLPGGTVDPSHDVFLTKISPAYGLAMSINPSTTTAGDAIALNRVILQDESNNTIQMTPVTVTPSISTNPGNATLQGVVPATIDKTTGLAGFTTLMIQTAANNYKLAYAVSGGFTTASVSSITSNFFNITHDDDTWHLVFSQQPTNTVAGAAINGTNGIIVQLRDSYENVITTVGGAGIQVTLSLADNPGGNLYGTLTGNITSGQVSFTNVRIDEAFDGYSLKATPNAALQATDPANNIVDIDSASFNILPAAPARVNFVTDFGPGEAIPSPQTAGVAFPDVQVEILDSRGNRATSATNTVTVEIDPNFDSSNGSDFLATQTGSNPKTYAALASRAAVSGVATFSGALLRVAANGYRLRARATGLTNDTSLAFDISPAGAATCRWETQPQSSVVAGVNLTPAPQVRLYDEFGNRATTASDPIEVTIANNPGSDPQGPRTYNSSNGLATVSTYNLTRAGVGYTLDAHLATDIAGGPSAATSSAFTVIPAAANKLRYSAPPTDSTDGGVIPPAGGIKVQILDAFDNPVTTDNSTNVTIRRVSGAGSLSSTTSTTKQAVAGVATFSDLIATNTNDVGAEEWLLQAEAAGLNGTDDGTLGVGDPEYVNRFNVRGPTQLGMASQDTTVAAGSDASAVVEIRDSTGARVTTFSPAVNRAVTAQIDSGPSGGSLLDGTNNPVATVAGTIGAAPGGQATFANLRFNKVGDYVLRFTGKDKENDDLTDILSATITVTPGPADHLVVTTEPTAVTRGVAIAPAPVVQLRDQFDNLVTGATNPVTMSIVNGGGAFTADSTTQVDAVAGVATFDNLKIDGSGNHGLRATVTGLANPTVDTALFNVRGASQLGFTVQPSESTAGLVISPSVRVAFQDNLGNTVPLVTNDVTLAIGNVPTGGTNTLGGTLTRAAVAGVATFNDLVINNPGNGYDLVASTAVGGVTGATSAAFNVLGPSKLVIVGSGTGKQPTPATQTQALAQSLTVELRDNNDRLVPVATNAVNLAIQSGPAGGSLLDASLNPIGALQATAVGGVATFNTANGNALRLSVGTGGGTQYVLAATSTGLAGDATDPFDINGPNKLAVSQQPTATEAGLAVTPPVKVEVQDVNGVKIPNAVNDVTLTIGNNNGANPGSLVDALGAPLASLTAPAVAGEATFSNVRIDKEWDSYTLAVTSPGLTGGESNAFAIQPDGANTLFFSVEPSNATAGAVIAPAIRVGIKDAFGNVVLTGSQRVTLTIFNNPPGDGTLLDANDNAIASLAVDAVNGVATFNNVRINRSGQGYRLLAQATGLSSGTSATFDIITGTPAKLAVRTQPSNGSALRSLTPAVEVEIRDAFDNLVTSATNQVTATKSAASPAGNLTGGGPVTAVGGVATFNSLQLDRAGANFELDFAATGLQGVTSATFDINNLQLVFDTPPSTTRYQETMAPVVVSLRDGANNLIANPAVDISLAIGTNPGGATLTGGGAQTTAAGQATFSGLSLDRPGTGYTLIASTPLPGVSPVTSPVFDITPFSLVFVTPPVDTRFGATMADVVVEIQDIDGNPVVAPARTITLALQNNPTNANLSGTSLSVATVNGRATFSGLQVDAVGNGYTLSASAPGLGSFTSPAFNVTPLQLVFDVQPQDTIFGATMADVQVSVRDAGNNLITTPNRSITLALGNNPTSATLTGTALTVNTTGGVATFSGLNINQVGAGYTLVATTADANSGTSSAFNITPLHLVFDVQPQTTIFGATMADVQVSVRDAGDNIVTTPNRPITLALGNNPSSATLTGTALTVNTTNGVATFTGLNLDRVGTGYTLTATTPDATAATSSAFDITPLHLAFTVEPQTTIFGATMATVRVAVRDAADNVVTTPNRPITLALGNNPTSATLTGTLTRNTTNGIASFPGLRVDQVGAGYTLVATTPDATGTASAAFDVTPLHLQFDVQPVDTTFGLAMADITVSVRDVNNNLVANPNRTIDLAFGNNPSGANISGPLSVVTSGGVATFSGLEVDTIGLDYTLIASTADAASATSAAFDITPLHLAFDVQPTNTRYTETIADVVVSVRDGAGDIVTGPNRPITLSLGTNPAGGTLTGTQTVTTTNGVATFTGLKIDRVGDGYQFRATTPAAEVADAFSTEFSITPLHLAFTVEPSDTRFETTIAPAVRVAVMDVNDNIVTTPVRFVTLALASGPTGATLSGTVTRNTINGVATFAGLSVDVLGSGYTLVASTADATSATSAEFAYTPLQLTFDVQPQNTRFAEPLADVTVSIRDVNGTLVTTPNRDITLALGNNPSGATLSGTLTATTANGRATFSGLALDNLGAGYTLQASSPNLLGATSDPFDVTALSLQFDVQPTDTGSGVAINPAVEVSLRDVDGNIVTTQNRTITLALGANPASGTLSGTLQATTVNGVATFADLTLDKVGTGYTLTASEPDLTTVTSDPFAIVAGVPTLMVLDEEPANGVAGVVLAPAPRVRLFDANGNLATNAATEVTVALGQNAGLTNLGGTVTRTPVNGVVTFDDLTLTLARTGYTLTLTATGVPGLETSPFDIVPAPVDPDRSTLVGDTGAIIGDGLDDLGLTVTVLDAFDNPRVNVPAAQVVIQAPNGTTAIQPAAPTDAAGQATAAVTSTTPGVYTIRAVVEGVTLTNEVPLTVSPRIVDPANTLITVAPTSIGSDGLDTATITVSLRDASNQPVLSSPVADRTVTVTGATTDGSGLTITGTGQTTGADGVFRVTATASAVDTYTVQITVGGVALNPAVIQGVGVYHARYVPGLYLTGLPIAPSTPDPLSVLGNGNWRLARYDSASGNFVTFSPQTAGEPFNFQPGRGLWVRFNEETNLRVIGAPVANAPQVIPLASGWSNLANPFDGPLPWNLDDIKVRFDGREESLGNPEIWDVVLPFGFIFDGQTHRMVFDSTRPGFSSVLNSVPKLSGFWFRCFRTGVELVLPPATPGASRAGRARQADLRNWAVNLLAAQDGQGNGGVVVGVTADISRALQVERPPLGPDGSTVTLELVDDTGRALLGELRPAGAVEGTWTLRSRAAVAGPVTLSWPDLLRNLPRGLVIELVDQTTGQATLLNTRGSYAYTASRAGEERRFQLRSRIGNIQRTTIQTMSAQPTRGGGTSLALTLTGPAEITLEVRGLGGRVVKQLRQTATAAGTVTVEWDGTDQNGRPVPAGTYLVQATAESPNGALSSVSRTVAVR